MNTLNDSLTAFDPDIAALIDGELRRQESGLEMIASENYAPLAVMQAQGSVLTNKYAEGYPGRRYYGGCEFVDGVEQLAIDRVKALFGAEYANVQPHSGATANAATMHALLNPGDTILGLSLAHGGHLTHGMRINFSGKLYHATAYEVSKEDYLVDMDAVAEAARTHRPKMIIAGWSAYPRQLDFARFRAIADEVDGRLTQPDVAERGIAVLTGGTDVHLVLVDLRDAELDGQQAEDRLAAVDITVNRNAVPFDPRPPMITSGLRIGTPALAARGFSHNDFRAVADLIAAALTATNDDQLGPLRAQVQRLAARYPLYPELHRT
ncbi:serine hydroxymethyltransferase [Mycobacterium tuberculosis]|uniref:serine hydroxymethyltransferase n=1 Tax=Mycobacterium tuberculosis TaxID=1773 RepID=UPI0004598919|nr:serine hydroxymethyltransferase [Mycobacterium tuberculosis]KCG02894.1 serine hydroxymethyltransferase GlyA2 [Mycobacterium tuberculosis KT-0041]